MNRRNLGHGIFSLVAISWVFAGCGGEVAWESARSAKQRVMNPVVGGQDLQALTQGAGTFAFDLYRRLKGREGNLFFSPYSISIALSMVSAGARTETLQEMEQVLHLLPQAQLHPAFNALDLALTSRGRNARAQDGGQFRLRISNDLWGQTGYRFLSAFLDTLAENYGAGLRLLDFERAPEAARVTINRAVESETEGKIKDLLPQGSVDALTRLVLTNAIYFNAAWKKAFDPQKTQPGAFHLLSGGQVTVPMMSREDDFRCAEGDGFQAVELPYDGEELSLVAILPPAGRFQELENTLDVGKLGAILGALASRKVVVALPRFKVELGFSVKAELSALGMGRAFSPTEADFSGIDGTRALRITDVVHKAFVLVNEAGTEAAAATGVVVGITSAPSEVRFDRPFLFLIRDHATGAILFLGRVVDPS